MQKSLIQTLLDLASFFMLLPILMFMSNCASPNPSISSLSSTPPLEIVSTVSLTPTLEPSSTFTPQPTFTASPSPTSTFTPTPRPTYTPRPTHTPKPTATTSSSSSLPPNWHLYEQPDDIFTIGYPPHWEQSPFPFTYNAVVTLYPSNEPIFVKFEVELIYDPSDISVQEVADIMGELLLQDPYIELFPLEEIEISGHQGLVRDIKSSQPVEEGGEESMVLLGRHYYFVHNDFSFIITALADDSVYAEYEADFDDIISTLHFPSD